MASTIASHVADSLAACLKKVAESTGHSRSRIISTAMQAFLSLSPRGMKAIDLTQQTGSKEEKEFLAQAMSRAAIRAREQIIDARYADRPMEISGNTPLETDEQIAAEAVRMCR